MSRSDDMKNAWNELREAGLDLSLAGLEDLSKKAKDLSCELEEFIDWGRKGEA